MIASLRRIGTAVLALSVLGLLVGYAPAILSCPLPSDCAAMLSIYYPGEAPEFFPVIELGEFMSGSTAKASTYSTIAHVFEIIQVTSLYGVLLAGLILMILELEKIPQLRRFFIRHRTR